MSDDITRTSPPDRGAALASNPGAGTPSVLNTSLTQSLPSATWPTISGAPTVPGYELLAELGRGAMGVVYRARDVKLNRIVALKMVLGADQADPRRLVRFLAEAEAVAAVRHPHVVQVYEFGEAGGHPFIALEYLPGGTLTARVKEPMPPQTAALLLAQIARGVAAAHEQSIVHRDVKSGNVLFDADGKPKVTDFGLAKRAGTSDLTATQAVMGTPAYMSPEQAGGGGKFVGPQTDVWALGVVLYECLTGVRPFDAEDVQGILAQVLMASPLPPRKRVPTVPRDLELICMKCLSKQPLERYPTAKELADDLDHFTRGETISVRPAGRVERTTKWVKRNKVVAAALAVVAFALLVGSAVSLAFGIEAGRQARRANDEAARANDEAARAEREAEDAVRERNAAVVARNDFQKANDALLGTLARSLLAPLTADRQGQSLTPYEIEAFWELAARRGEPVGYRFLEQATQTRLACDQLAGRTDYALHAAIGLDVELWERWQRLLVARLADPSANPEQRKTLALICAGLEPVTPALTEQTAATLTEVLAGTSNPDEVLTIAGRLAAVAVRLEPAKAVVVRDRAAEVLTDALARTFHSPALGELAVTLAAIIRGMEPTRAAAICDKTVAALTKAIGNAVDQQDLGQLASGLAAVVERVEPAKAAAICDQVAGPLIEAMTKTQSSGYSYGSPHLDTGLAAIARRMEPTRAATLLAEAMAKMTDTAGLHTLGEALRDILPRLEPGPAAALLTRAMAKTQDMDALRELTIGLAPLLDRLDPATAAPLRDRVADELLAAMSRTGSIDTLRTLEATFRAAVANKEPTRVAAMLVATMGKTTDPDALEELQGCLAATLNHLPPGEASRFYEQAAELLFAAMGTAEAPEALGGLTRALCRLVERLDRPTAAAHCDKAAGVLVAALSRMKNQSTANVVSASLTRLFDHLTPAQVTATSEKALTAIFTAMATTTNGETLRQTARSLQPLLRRLEPARAAAFRDQAAGVLREAIARTSDGNALQELARTLSAFVREMDPGKAADLLTETMTRTTNTECRAELAVGLTAVAERMDPARGAALLTGAMTKFPDENSQYALAKGLTALAAKLEPAPALTVLTTATTRAADPVIKGRLAVGLVHLSRRLGAADADALAVNSAGLLIEAMTRTTHTGYLADFGDSLRLVVGKLEPVSTARQVTAAMGKTADYDALRELALSLVPVTQRLEPAAAEELRDKALGLILDVMSKTTEPSTLRALNTAIVRVIEEMKPAREAAIRARAGSILMEMLGRTTDQGAIVELSTGLDELVGGMEPGRAAEFILTVMSRLTNPENQVALAQSLAAVAHGLPLAEWHRRHAGLLAAGPIGTPDGLLPGLTVAHPFFHPQPKPMSPPALVELLKHPFCVGPARRAILDALGYTYRRPFADQWAFARFAKDTNLPLDLLGPARRPQP